MLKKTIKLCSLVLILSASLGSFLYINSSSIKLDISNSIAFEQAEILPDENSIATPAIAVVNKAIIIAKCFLYPTE